MFDRGDHDCNSWRLKAIATICLLEWNWTFRFPFIKSGLHRCLGGTRKKLTGLVLRGQGRGHFLEDVQRELEGLVLGSNLLQPHFTAEEYWNQLERPEDTQYFFSDSLGQETFL